MEIFKIIFYSMMLLIASICIIIMIINTRKMQKNEKIIKEGNKIIMENIKLSEEYKTKTTMSTSKEIKCSCKNGMIVCLGCNGKKSKFGICAGCDGKGIRTCGKCGGLNKLKMSTSKEKLYTEEEVITTIKAFHLDSLEGIYSKELLEWCNKWIKNNLINQNKENE